MVNTEETVFYSIEKAIKSYRQFAQKNFTGNGLDITIDQGMILHIIRDHPGITQQQIAVKAFKDHASVTRIIENLVGRKILLRNFHADDRRRFHLTITDAGLAMIGQMKRVIAANREKAIAGISPGEIDLLKELLGRITDNCLTKNKQ